MTAPDRDPARVQAMFDRVARRYRVTNTILSGGQDTFWRRKAAAIVKGWLPTRVLDLATGSGDLARAIERAIPGVHVTGADFSAEMLAVARRLGSQDLVQADALALPFAEATFQAVTVSFGLRNMASWVDALREMHRVLEPGGHVLILDFSVPAGPLRHLYRPYLHHVLPHLAGLLTGEGDAYRYLGDSIEAFPSGAALCDLMKEAGLIKTTAEPLTGGVVTLYTAQKPTSQI